MQQDIGLARAFVAAICGGNAETICDFRAIHDQNKTVPAHAMRGTITDLWSSLCAWNDAGYGIFAVVNALDGQGLKLPNVQANRAHYVDLDKGDVMQNFERIKQWSPAPSFAVNSSPGKVHVYWCVQPYRDNTRFETIQRKLVSMYGGDRAVIDATRVMRLPGTIHRKTDTPHLVTCYGLAGAALGPIDAAALESALAGVQTGAGGGAGRRALGDATLSAPSLEWALTALRGVDPNSLDRAGWITVTSAWKQAAWNHDQPHMVRYYWDEWCLRYASNEPSENEKQWNSIRDTEVGFNNLIGRTPNLKAVFMFGAPPPVATPVPPPMSTPVEPPKNGHIVEFGSFLTADECKSFFKECIFVERFGEMLVHSGRLMGPQAFNGTFGGKQFIIDANGKATDDPWKAALRSTLWQVPKVDHLRFVPQQPFGTTLKDAMGRPGINMYKPFTVPRKTGDVSPFLNHMALIMPDANDRKIYLDYLAHNVRFPGYKIPWAPLLQSEEGAGKGVIKKVMYHCMGNNYVHEPKAQELIESGSKFNAWMRGKLMIIVDEIRVDERRDMIEVLKPMISEERIEIQGKGVDQETEDNFSNWLFFSNWKNAIAVRKNGRRFAIFYSAIQSLEDLVRRGMNQSYFDWIYAWLDNGGKEIVANWLLDYPITCGTIPMRAPATTSTPEAIEQSRSPVEALIYEAIEDQRAGFRGGWISSTAATMLAKQHGYKVQGRMLGRIIEEMGYKIIGRATRPYFQEDAGTRPMLYAIHAGAEVVNYGKLQGYE